MIGKICSEETKAKILSSKMGIPKSGETKAKMAAWERYEETRAKMSASQMGNSNSKNQPSSIKIQVRDLETNISTTYDSMHAAARALNIGHKIISNFF